MLFSRVLAGRWNTESKSLLEGKYKGPRTWQALKRPCLAARRLLAQTHAANAAAGGARGGTDADNVAYVSSQYPQAASEKHVPRSRSSQRTWHLLLSWPEKVLEIQNLKIFCFSISMF